MNPPDVWQILFPWNGYPAARCVRAAGRSGPVAIWRRTELIFNTHVRMVAYTVSALGQTTRPAQADARNQFGRADVFWAECDSRRERDARYVAVKHSGSAEEYVTNVSTCSPAFFTRHSVQGLCRMRAGHEAWLRMSGETPLFVVVADTLVMCAQPPASIRVELNGRQLAGGEQLKLANQSVVEVRYAEAVNQHGAAAYKRWKVLFSAQYGHLEARRRQTEHGLRDLVNTLRGPRPRVCFS